jgi:hypothetical protein
MAATDSMKESPGLVQVTGNITVDGGATVVGHNVWSGGALPVAVTLLGWMTLIKGLVLMTAPPRVLSEFCRAPHYPARSRLIMAVALTFSRWLTFTAFVT